MRDYCVLIACSTLVSVGVSAVRYGDHVNDEFVLDDAINHAVLAAAGRVQWKKWLVKLLPQTLGVLREGAHDEFKSCGSNLLGQSFGESPPC